MCDNTHNKSLSLAKTAVQGSAQAVEKWRRDGRGLRRALVVNRPTSTPPTLHSGPDDSGSILMADFRPPCVCRQDLHYTLGPKSR